MKTVDMKIKFNLIDWCSSSVLNCIPLKDVNPENFNSDSFKKKVIEENEDRKIVRSFLETLKLKFKQNHEDIKKYQSRFNNSIANPFPELIELPETKHLKYKIWSQIKLTENKEVFYTLLENNQMPNYQELVWNISNDYWSRKNVYLSDGGKPDNESYLNIFKSTIALCNHVEVQTLFEYLSEQYLEIQKIDSKKETKEKYGDFCYEFHKSLRQTDALGNGHAESIIWNLLQVTDIPHLAIKAVIEHVHLKKQEEVEK